MREGRSTLLSCGVGKEYGEVLPQLSPGVGCDSTAQGQGGILIQVLLCKRTSTHSGSVEAGLTAPRY